MVALRARAEASGQLAQMEAINTDRPGTRFRPRAQVRQVRLGWLCPSGALCWDRGFECCL